MVRKPLRKSVRLITCAVAQEPFSKRIRLITCAVAQEPFSKRIRLITCRWRGGLGPPPHGIVLSCFSFHVDCDVPSVCVVIGGVPLAKVDEQLDDEEHADVKVENDDALLFFSCFVLYPSPTKRAL